MKITTFRHATISIVSSTLGDHEVKLDVSFSEDIHIEELYALVKGLETQYEAVGIEEISVNLEEKVVDELLKETFEKQTQQAENNQIMSGLPKKLGTIEINDLVRGKVQQMSPVVEQPEEDWCGMFLTSNKYFVYLSYRAGNYWCGYQINGLGGTRTGSELRYDSKGDPVDEYTTHIGSLIEKKTGNSKSTRDGIPWPTLAHLVSPSVTTNGI